MAKRSPEAATFYFRNGQSAAAAAADTISVTSIGSSTSTGTAVRRPPPSSLSVMPKGVYDRSNRFARQLRFHDLNQYRPDSTSNGDGSNGVVADDYVPIQYYHNELERKWNRENFEILTPTSLVTLTGGIFVYVFTMQVVQLCSITAYFANKDYWNFFMTLVVASFANLGITLWSAWWYLCDKQDPERPNSTNIQCMFRVAFHLVLLGPVVRQMEVLWFAARSYRAYSRNRIAARRYLLYMLLEYNNAKLLKLIRSFLLNAPQTVLQLSIMFRNLSHKRPAFHAVMLTAMSIMVLAYDLFSYIKDLRRNMPHKKSLTIGQSLTPYLWHLFILASRLVTLALFGSEYPRAACTVMFFHWLAMFFWLRYLNTRFGVNKYEEIVYQITLAIMYVFTFLNPIDSPTRNRYTIYYVTIFIEMIIMLTFWYRGTDEYYHHNRAPVLAFCIVSFFSGLTMMAIYLLFVHPAINIWHRPGDEPRTSTVKSPAEIVASRAGWNIAASAGAFKSGASSFNMNI